MKILVQWEIHPDRRAEVFAGFAAMELADYQAGGGPEIKTLGRWHDLINGRGFGVYETDDPAALSSWVMQWNPAVDFDVSIVHDDAEAHALVREHVTAQD